MQKQEPLFVSEFDRWIIGALLFALAAVLWWIMLDIRTQSNLLALTVGVNTNRITDIERRIDTIENAHTELKDEIKTHRTVTETLRPEPGSALPYHRNGFGK